jgi:DNA-binding NarL/FixJ family response regulator/DNA-directed RNA polymerase subunit RPC12/RpoP
MSKPFEKTEKNLKILIVDDLDFERKMLDMMLEATLPINYEIDYASTGDEGLRKILQCEFDIIFLDNKLPGKSGLEILKEINRQKLDLNVIFLTGYGDEELAVKAIKLGAKDYISKEKLDTPRLLNSISDIIINYSFPEEIQPDIIHFISDLFSESIEFTPNVVNGLVTNDEQKFGLDVIDSLNLLTEKGFVEKKPVFSISSCPECHSITDTHYFGCPICSSKIMSKSNVLEHKNCGHTDFRENFYTPSGELICPKCEKTLRQVGVDYIKAGVHYKCKNSHLFTAPLHSYLCRKCMKELKQNDTDLMIIHSYRLKKKGFTRFKVLKKNNVKDLDDTRLISPEVI